MLVGRGASGVERLLVCRVGSKLCGLPLRHVVETMRPQPVEQLANMPPSVCGLAIIRGRPTPVLDARRLLGADSTVEPGRSITLTVGRRTLALLVDAVVGIRGLDAEQLGELPLVLKDSGDEVEALGLLDAELLLVLGHARLLKDEHFASLEAGST